MSRTFRRAERRKISHAAAQTKNLARQRTQHLLTAASKRWELLATPSPGEEIPWLNSPCPGRPTIFDPTHDLQLHRGLWFCRVCGAWAATKALKLGSPCLNEAKKNGKDILQRIQADQLPKGCSGWPDQAGESHAGLEIVSDICQARPTRQ